MVPVIYMDRESAAGLGEEDIREIVTENEDSSRYKRLEGYYTGDHDILRSTKKDSTAPNNRLVNNIAKYITDTAVGYFVGKPVVYNSNNDEYLAKVQDVFDYNDEQDHNTELAKTGSIDGTCFEMLYIDEDAMVRFVKVNPENCILICETGNRAPLAAIRTIRSTDRKKNVIRKVEYWTPEVCWYFRSVNGSRLQLLDMVEHYWQDAPFVEYINNEERLGDFEGVISLIDGYNRVQSNTANYFQYNDEALLKISKLGDVTSQDIRDMKEKGAIILEDGGDIDWLIKQVGDTGLENYKTRLKEDIHTFSNVPNLADQSFGGNQSGVAVSYKLWSFEQMVAIKERKFKRGLQRRIELITNILNIQGGHYDFRDIDIQFRRNKPQNLLEVAQIITMLANDVSRETRLQLLPTIDDVQDELRKLEEEKEKDMRGFGSYDSVAKALAAAEQQATAGAAAPQEGNGKQA